MKKLWYLWPALGACLCLSGCSLNGGGALAVLLLILAACFLILAILRTSQYRNYVRRRKRRGQPSPKGPGGLTVCLYLLGFILLLVALLVPNGNRATAEEPQTPVTDPAEQTEPTQETEPPVLFAPEKTPASDPAKWGITWEIFQDGILVENYQREEPIDFGDPESYFALPGIPTFRGNNYRNSTTYGTADVTEQTMTLDWTSRTGVLAGGVWSGSGWTGQPLIVQWDEQTRQNMNLYSSKKNKDGLVEVIYATLDGHIYFLDLEDGSYTRDPINVGQCFKGAGALDPRGYPIMYVGTGDVSSDGRRPRMYIISLIDGSILFEYGHYEKLSVRHDNGDWCAFDSSPLVYGPTDTLIWPGESGILYTMTLNTRYDAEAGTLSVNPSDMVVTRYDTGRSSKENYWYGYEASVDIVGSYLYVSENGGMFFCVDLNTMELVWAQDTKDDSNCSPVFEKNGEDGGYIYTAPSLHWTRGSSMYGPISLYKLDAVTDEIVWEKAYNVHTVDGVSGGVQSTPLLGKEGTDIEGMIFYTISRIPDVYTGYLVALDTETGEEIWRMNMNNYAWSSPVAVYDEDGTGYVVVCDSAGDTFFLRGSTGAVLDTLNLGGLVEATPAVYEDMLVVGTRAQQICGIKVK